MPLSLTLSKGIDPASSEREAVRGVTDLMLEQDCS